LAKDQRRQYRRFLKFAACYHLVFMGGFLISLLAVSGRYPDAPGWYWFWVPSALSVFLCVVSSGWPILRFKRRLFGGGQEWTWWRDTTVRVYLVVPPVVATAGLIFEIQKLSRDM
jgi:hypothetical protein